jgi:hypothetical protein
MHVWNSQPPNTTAARAALAKACDSGSMPTACQNVQKLDADAQAKAAQIDALWGAVVEVGDDFTQKRHVATLFAQMARPSQQYKLQQIHAINAATVNEQYCPAKKAFLAEASATEFAKRAAAHCRDQPPTGNGLSGAQVTLTAECNSV